MGDDPLTRSLLALSKRNARRRNRGDYPITDFQKEARAKRVKDLLHVARQWEPAPKRDDVADDEETAWRRDYAAQLRVHARVTAKDPNFADMEGQDLVWREIADTVTAETEALHEKQARAAKS